MKNFLLSIFLLIISIHLLSQELQQIEAKRIQLPNGWSLTPVGKSIALGDLPLNIAVSNNKKLLAVTNNGQSVQTIQLVDVVSNKELSNIVIPKSWYGLKFSADDQYLFASGGNDNIIWKYAINKNKQLIKVDSIILGKGLPNKISPAGIEINEANKELYVVTKDDNCLYTVNLKTKIVTNKIYLGAEAYTCLISPDNKTLYISLWGGDKVLFYNVAKKTIVDSINVGDNPNELCITKNGKYLFVANANDNSVSVIDVIKNKVIETLNAALYPNAPSGSTSNGVALSSNEKTLYIANADNNCLAVFDISEIGKSKAKGFIPVGWYPTNVKVVGNKIFVSNGKGFTSLPNPLGPNPFGNKQTVSYRQSDNQKPKEVQYIAGLFKGTLSIINEPTDKQLSIYSQAVYHNTPYSKNKELNAAGESGNPIPMKVGTSSPIKHIFYIIKENRTFDQVLSDVPGGNGDTSLLLFGERYTPNQHAIVKQFVLLDNFYCDAEVSADGHNWSMGGYATDYLEKTWPTYYGGRGGDYDAEGKRAIANNKNGFIWDLCKRNHVSYRTYGEFADDYKPNIPSVKNNMCNYYTGWDLDFKDSARFFQWKQDFDSLLALNAVPQFNTIRFGNDHTEGLRVGKLTPYAHVADNDLAVGMFIDYLSKSSIWKESAVFIVEDDAQNGADHVDAHRSTAYIISPFIKRKFVDHTMYSTTSILRTIELILGMPPMTQYDAAAMPMWRSFTPNANFSSFNYLPETVNLNEKNKAINKASMDSNAFDFSHEDNVPDFLFNEVLWQGLKGKSAPSPTRAAFVKLNNKKEKDND